MNLKILVGGAVAAATAVVLTSVAIAQNSTYQNPGASVHDLNRNAQGTAGNVTGNMTGAPPANAPATAPDQSMNNPNTGGYSSSYRGYTNAPGAQGDTAQDQGAAPSGGMAGERG